MVLIHSSGAESTKASSPALPAKTNLHLYLLMGQSNMAGRGEVGDEDKQTHPRVLMFNLSNSWELATEPITRDRKSGLGVGPGLAFGKEMAARETGITIGLVPCAVGGTPLRRWERGGDLYSNAVHRARLALRDGTLKGILWHQGESNSGTKASAEGYTIRLTQMVSALREDLASPQLPFVAGQLGEFLYDRGPDKTPFARVLNESLARIGESSPHTACVSSKGLNHKGDQLHFNSESQRELGKRYSEAMRRLNEF
jgi:hypothetical protein